MARKRPKRKNQKLLDLIRKECQPELAKDVQEAHKDLTSTLLGKMFKANLMNT